MASAEGPQKLSSADLGDLEELEPLVCPQRASSPFQPDNGAQFEPTHFAVHNEMYRNNKSLILMAEECNNDTENDIKELLSTARRRNISANSSSNGSLSALARSTKTENDDSDERLNESSFQEILSQLPSSKWRLTSVDAILEHQKAAQTRSERNDSCDALFYDDDPQANLEVLREQAIPLREKRLKKEGLKTRQRHQGGHTHHKPLGGRCRKLNCGNFPSKINVFGKLMKMVQAESGGAIVAFFKLLMMLLVFNLITGSLFMAAVVLPTKLQHEDKNMNDLLLDRGSYPSDDPNTHLVYLLTVGTVYIGTFVYLVMAIGNWLKTNIIWIGSSQMITNIVFRGWDCSIASKRGAEIEKKLLVKTISDIEEEDRSRTERHAQRTFRGKLIRFLIHFLIIVIISSEWYLIYQIVKGNKISHWIQNKLELRCVNKTENCEGYLSYPIVKENDTSHGIITKQTNRYAEMIENIIISIILVLFSKITKLLFRLLAKFEKQNNRNTLLLSVLRNLCIYLVSVVILVQSELANDGTGWEKRLAERIRSQIINTTIIEIVLETVITMLKLCITCIRTKIKKTTVERTVLYKVDDRVLIVVKLQALSWIGMVVCPAVPFITAACLFTLIFFCIVKVLVVRPRPEHAILGTNTSTIFVAAVFVTLLVTLGPVIQIIFFTEQSSMNWDSLSEKNIFFKAAVTQAFSNGTQTLEGIGIAARTQASKGNNSLWLALFVIAVLTIQVLALVYFVAQAKARLLRVFTLGIRLKRLCHFRKKLISKFTKKFSSKTNT